VPTVQKRVETPEDSPLPNHIKTTITNSKFIASKRVSTDTPQINKGNYSNDNLNNWRERCKLLFTSIYLYTIAKQFVANFHC
jgi:hypothetical protein